MSEAAKTIDPGEGYRLLERSEHIQNGDEFLNYAGMWIDSECAGQLPVDFAYRRKLLPAHVESELSTLRAANAELLSALELYGLSYSDADLNQLAECQTGRGEIDPATAKREIIRRKAIAKAKGQP